MKEEINIGLYLRIISKEIKQLVDKKLDNDLTNIQIGILCYINKAPKKQIYQKDIEQFLKVRRSTTTEILSTMERKKLIKRVEEQTDKRKKIITLTKEGKNKVKKFQEIITEINNNLLNDITKEQQKNLQNSLEQIRKNIKNLQEEI